MELKEEKLSRAISASSRREILRLLVDRELTAKDISQKTGMSVSLTSKHLTLLYDLGLINVRKELPFKYYSLKIKQIKQLLDIYDQVIDKI